jgi:uncharacterized repeat protein (TIGR03803 family)
MERYKRILGGAAGCALLCLLSACGDDDSGAGNPIPYTGDAATPSGLMQASDGNFYGTSTNGGRYSQGAFFMVTPGGVEKVLYSFAGGAGDGSNPEDVIQGKDGNFYGATGAGGIGPCPGGCGIIFKITPAGAESVLYFFTGGADGGSPNDLLLGSDGNFYGAAALGGSMNGVCSGQGCGVVFRLTPSGTLTTLYAFQGGTTDGAEAAYVIQGSDGNLYGNTVYGGSSDNGTVFELTLGGVETILHSFAGGNDGAIPFAPLTQGSDGNLYGTTQYGGTYANGVVFTVHLAPVPAGTSNEAVLHAFAGTMTEGANPVSTALVQGSDGNLYGTTSSGGNPNCAGGCGTVFKITTSGTFSTLYLFATGAGNVPPNPTSLIQANDSNFYGTTSQGGGNGFGTVFKMTPAGETSVLYNFGTNP